MSEAVGGLARQIGDISNINVRKDNHSLYRISFTSVQILLASFTFLVAGRRDSLTQSQALQGYQLSIHH